MEKQDLPGQKPVPEQQPAQMPLEALAPAEALAALQADPVRFVQRVVSDATGKHLALMKEEAEMQGALNVFLKANPDAGRFLPFILQEVRTLIANDDDGAIDPWETLLNKGLAQFREKFKETLKKQPELLEQAAAQSELPYQEGKANRVPQPLPPSFTRDQIANMSLEAFLENESAINEALKSNRIR